MLYRHLVVQLNSKCSTVLEDLSAVLYSTYVDGEGGGGEGGDQHLNKAD